MGEQHFGPVTIQRVDGSTETHAPYDRATLVRLTKKPWRQHAFGSPGAEQHGHQNGVAAEAECGRAGCARTVPWRGGDALYCGERCRRLVKRAQDRARQAKR